MQDNLEEELAQAFVRLCRMFSKGSVILEGFIIDVNLDTFTCTVNIPRNSWGTSVDNYFYKVPLKVLQGSQASLVEIPHVTSHCLLTFKDNNIQRPQLYLVDQCDKLLIKIGNSTLEINTGKDDNGNDTPGIIFNGGEQGNTVLLGKVVEKLNLLEKDINKLRTSFNTWVVVPSDGGAALKAASTGWSSQNLTVTNEDDLKNKNILQ
jgi:hypothetical protein